MVPERENSNPVLFFPGIITCRWSFACSQRPSVLAGITAEAAARSLFIIIVFMDPQSIAAFQQTSEEKPPKQVRVSVITGRGEKHGAKRVLMGSLAMDYWVFAWLLHTSDYTTILAPDAQRDSGCGENKKKKNEINERWKCFCLLSTGQEAPEISYCCSWTIRARRRSFCLPTRQRLPPPPHPTPPWHRHARYLPPDPKPFAPLITPTTTQGRQRGAIGSFWSTWLAAAADMWLIWCVWKPAAHQRNEERRSEAGDITAVVHSHERTRLHPQAVSAPRIWPLSRLQPFSCLSQLWSADGTKAQLCGDHAPIQTPPPPPTPSDRRLIGVKSLGSMWERRRGFKGQGPSVSLCGHLNSHARGTLSPLRNKHLPRWIPNNPNTKGHRAFFSQFITVVILCVQERPVLIYFLMSTSPGKIYFLCTFICGKKSAFDVRYSDTAICRL